MLKSYGKKAYVNNNRQERRSGLQLLQTLRIRSSKETTETICCFKFINTQSESERFWASFVI